MIEIKNLSKHFGNKKAVDDISLEIPAGSMYGFLGPNGAGKTTTLRMLMGLIQPTSGTALIDGTDVRVDPLKVKSIAGYLPDEIFLYDYLSGRQFLEFLADIHNLDKDESKKQITHLLDLFNLSDAADDYTANYSFGMKKKIALAGIVIHSPKFLILDEPFNGLDPQAIKDFRQLIQDMIKAGTTIIFSSHVLEVVEKLVSDVAIICNGKIKAEGKLEKLIEKHGDLEKAFFSSTNTSGN